MELSRECYEQQQRKREKCAPCFIRTGIAPLSDSCIGITANISLNPYSNKEALLDGRASISWAGAPCPSASSTRCSWLSMVGGISVLLSFYDDFPGTPSVLGSCICGSRLSPLDYMPFCETTISRSPTLMGIPPWLSPEPLLGESIPPAHENPR